MGVAGKGKPDGLFVRSRSLSPSRWSLREPPASLQCMAMRTTKTRFKRTRRRSRLGDWWLLWRVPILTLAVMAAWWFVFRPIAQERGWVQVSAAFAICGADGERQEGCVIDGDTVMLGFDGEQRRIRLLGFDAPELKGACLQERQLALAARGRLHRWLAEGPFEWNGAEDPPRDRYGRELRNARRPLADGGYEELAAVMIASGLAAEDSWDMPERDWCAQ